MTGPGNRRSSALSQCIRDRRASLLAAVAGLVVASSNLTAMAQSAEPLDINAPRPVTGRAAGSNGARSDASGASAATAVGASNTSRQPAAAAPGGTVRSPGRAMPGVDGPAYRVSRFLIEWHLPSEHHPTTEEMMETVVTLGVTADGYVSAHELDAKGAVVRDAKGAAATRTGTNTVMLRLKDVGAGEGGHFHASAIREVIQAIVDELNARGFNAVFAHIAEDQVAMVDDGEHKVGDDLRDGKTEDLRVVIWTGQVGEVRTVASGPRLESAIAKGETTRVNADDPVHARIREQSPVNAGDLVHRDMIDDYLAKLNRHPGRRVEAAVSPGAKPEEVTLDYLVGESKPWTASAQLSNTGTKATNSWRERFTFEHDQVTKHDDTLRLDYVTGGFDQSHAVNLDYTFPLRSDSIKAHAYGSYSEYTASDVGLADESFTGRNVAGGADVIANVFQVRDLFIDATAGLKWQSIDVTNSLLSQDGSDSFFTSSLGLSAEKFTDTSLFRASANVSWSLDDLDPAQKNNLGRSNVDASFAVVRMQVDRSFFIEPVLDRLGLFTGSDGKGPSSLAHEISLSARGQWAMANRLLPTEEDVAGGFFSVRGYPESLAAGDNVVIGSLEYRFHLPNSFSVSEPGKLGHDAMPTWFGRDFRWAPQEAWSRADWDLICKAFFDAASVNVVDKVPGELPDTLLGAGVGLELVLRRNLSARLDWGFALKDAGPQQAGSSAREVQAGDSRLHFMLTISY